MKKYLSLLLAAIMMLGLFAGCSLTNEGTEDPEASPEATQAVVAAEDSEPVVTVGGEVVLTWGQYQSVFNTNADYYYQSTGSDVTSTEEMLTQFQDLIVNYLTESSIISYQAKQQGFAELTAEQQAELQSKIDTELQSIDEYYRSIAQEEAAADSSVDVEARIKELVAEEAVYYTGEVMDYDAYIEWLKNRITSEYLGELLKEKAMSTVTVDDAAISDWYTTNSSTQKTTYTDNPASYKDAQESYELFGGEPVVYVPLNYSRVMDILVVPTGTMNEEYDTKIAQMDDLQTEYGTLSFEDALSGENTNAARLSEILAEYGTLKAETDAMYDEYMAEAKATIEAAYAELEGGASFADVMMKYTANVDFTDNEIFQQKGMLINPLENSTTSGWSSEVISAFMGLTAGTYSGVFMDGDGYHIIYYVGDETPGLRPMEEVNEGIKTVLLGMKQDTEWETLVEAWKADSSVVINEELVRLAGTVAVG